MKIQFFLFAALCCALLFTIPGCTDDFATDSVSLSSDVDQLSGRESEKTVRRAYRDNFSTWYDFIADIPGGFDPDNPAPFPGWYPGGGEGHATHVGKANTFFNQYVTYIFPNIVSLHAPVTMFFGDELAEAGYTDIPDDVGSIVFDNKGNSIWFQASSNISIPVGPTRIEFTGVNHIIGGTENLKELLARFHLMGITIQWIKRMPESGRKAGLNINKWTSYLYNPKPYCMMTN